MLTLHNLSLEAIYIQDDLEKWLMVMVSDRRASGDIFNVGSPDVVSLQYVAEVLAKHFKLGLKLASPDVEYRTIASKGYFPDVRKAKKLLDLEQSESSIEAVLRMAETIKKSQT